MAAANLFPYCLEVKLKQTVSVLSQLDCAVGHIRFRYVPAEVCLPSSATSQVPTGTRELESIRLHHNM